MKNNLIKRMLALCCTTLLLVTAAAGCGKKNGDPEPATVLTDCTITVQSEGGTPMENIGVSVYADTAKSDLLDFARTNADGTVSIKGGFTAGNAYVFLTDVPTGYTMQEYYPITEKTTVISLPTAHSTEMTNITLGGVMFDFSITDQNGSEHTLSELLKSKKAVVLNFWYTTCVPCKMEFPYLQQAYTEFQDDVALLALNPVDDVNAIAAFATENGLTMPMVACDPQWANLIDGIAYPTTVVIDRFGTVALIHVGGVDKTSTFKNLFAHFTADDYTQSTIEDISSFEATDEEPLGSATNPYIHSGDGSIAVTVDPGQTVYYTLLGADGLNLSVNGATLKLVCDETEYTPADGKIRFDIKAAVANDSVTVRFTNTGSEKATYKVVLTAPEGSATNPLTMKDGDVTVKLAEGNQRGVYYQYKAPYEGTFTLECKNTVNYTVSIRNLSGKETAVLDKNDKKATIDVRKNDQIQIVVTAVEKDGKFPAVEAKLSASSKKTEIPSFTSGTTGSSAGTSTTKKPTSTGSNSGSTGTTTQSGSSATNGKLVNPDEPIEFGGVLNFDAKVNAGEMVLYHVYRVNGTTLHIKDSSAYVIYKDKTYTPDKSGNIYIPVVSDSPNNPIVLKIGNSGKTNKTYAVKFSFPEGSLMNPYDAKAGTIKTKIAAGNDQGIYYTCTAEKDGKLTIVLKSVTSGVQCDIRVTVTDSSYIPQQYLLSETEDGKTLTIDIYADDEIQINVVALPDEDYKYPAATIESVLSFS